MEKVERIDDRKVYADIVSQAQSHSKTRKRKKGDKIAYEASTRLMPMGVVGGVGTSE